jgi:hypothetical protein
VELHDSISDFLPRIVKLFTDSHPGARSAAGSVIGDIAAEREYTQYYPDSAKPET